MDADVTNLADTARALPQTWHPQVVGRVNDQLLKVARLDGAFVWHDHPHEDEAFIVLEGRLRIEFDDGAVELTSGDLYVVPRGVRHRPVALGTCLIALIEPASTKHTGDAITERTVSVEQQWGEGSA